MARLLVSGLICLETNLHVDAFPLEYAPVRYPFFGVHTGVSGVGFNVAAALRALGDEVRLLSLVGDDAAAGLARQALAERGLGGSDVLAQLRETAQSVILVDGQGRRQIFADLKDIQTQVYPADAFERALHACEAAVLCNIAFSRPWLSRARALGRLVATDVHALAEADDAYNADFMAHADVLFMSHERLPAPPEVFAREVRARCQPAVLVIGLGAEGAYLSAPVAGVEARFPAVTVRPVVNTIGASDALFSAFVHFYVRDRQPVPALQRALYYAAYKIGENGGAAGLLDEAGLAGLMQIEIHR